MGRLQGRVAVVTGGGEGIGLGVSRRLAKEGATLVIAQRKAEVGEKVAAQLSQEFGVPVTFIKTDVCQKEQVNQLIQSTVEQFGRLDILINNAGGGVLPKPLEQSTDDEVSYSLNLNFWSTLWAMQAAFPHMKAQQYGRIVNFGSLNGVNAHMQTMPYNAAKEAVRALTRTAAVEWAQHGIVCNVICPAARSAAYDHFERAWPEAAAAITKQVPNRRMGDPERDIGGLAAFLASEDCAHVVGMTIHADGGSHVNGVSWRPDGD